MWHKKIINALYLLAILLAVGVFTNGGLPCSSTLRETCAPPVLPPRTPHLNLLHSQRDVRAYALRPPHIWDGHLTHLLLHPTVEVQERRVGGLLQRLSNRGVGEGGERGAQEREIGRGHRVGLQYGLQSHLLGLHLPPSLLKDGTNVLVGVAGGGRRLRTLNCRNRREHVSDHNLFHLYITILLLKKEELKGIAYTKIKTLALFT